MILPFFISAFKNPRFSYTKFLTFRQLQLKKKKFDFFASRLRTELILLSEESPTLLN
jgi:hypothetical protein